MAGRPSLKGRLVDSLADRNRGTLNGRSDPDGISGRPLRRNEAIEYHQTTVPRLPLLGFAVDSQNARRSSQHRTQEVGIVGIDRDRERRLGGKLELGVIVGGECVAGSQCDSQNAGGNGSIGKSGFLICACRKRKLLRAYRETAGLS